jgi:lytic murein transglycosylase
MNRIIRRTLTALSSLCLCLPVSGAAAQTAAGGSFSSYMQLLSAQARAEGVSENTIQQVIPGLTPNQRVIDLDRSQPGSPTTTGFPPMAPYIATHVDSARINGGRRVFASIPGSTATLIERDYGVPLPIVIAIFGHETNYGSYTGDFDLARSLATLAWEGRRRDLFASEFIALLKMMDQGIPRYRLTGSWAGAFGNPQFLPSVYLRLATDGDGDGRKDIWSSRPDTLASIANYFRDAGWRQGQPWGVPASVPASFDRNSIQTTLISPVCPRVHIRISQWKTVREWRNLGVQAQRYLADDIMAALFEPDGPGKPAYLLTGNYRVILEYNCSNYYALSVGLLADEISR